MHYAFIRTEIRRDIEIMKYMRTDDRFHPEGVLQILSSGQFIYFLHSLVRKICPRVDSLVKQKLNQG